MRFKVHCQHWFCYLTLFVFASVFLIGLAELVLVGKWLLDVMYVGKGC